VKDRQSPVAVWLSATFPQHKEIQTQFRIAAGPQRILMPAGVAPGTQGSAIDFWLRMLIDPQPSIALPLVGLLSGRAPCVRAGKELLSELAAGEPPQRTADGDVELRMRPAGFADRGDEWWARVCYALALLVELYRAAAVEHSRLMSLDARSGAADLLDLANDAEVADLVAMRDLAREQLVPALPAGPVATGMTFDGSADLGHVRPAHRRGVRGPVRLPRRVALAQLGQRMGGRPAGLTELRAQFAQILRTQLPPCQRRRGW
jgi:hypothetical protein